MTSEIKTYNKIIIGYGQVDFEIDSSSPTSITIAANDDRGNYYKTITTENFISSDSLEMAFTGSNSNLVRLIQKYVSLDEQHIYLKLLFPMFRNHTITLDLVKEELPLDKQIGLLKSLLKRQNELIKQQAEEIKLLKVKYEPPSSPPSSTTPSTPTSAPTLTPASTPNGNDTKPTFKPKSQGRTTKNQEKIKRPPPSFILYFRDVHQKVYSENKSLKVPEVSKLVGSMWRALPHEEKQKYRKIADKNMSEYKEARRTLRMGSEHTEEVAPKKRKLEEIEEFDDEFDEFDLDDEEESFFGSLDK